MAFPVAAAISAGATLLGSGASMVSTGKLNKKNRQWQEDMWNKTNEYNSPIMQMNRFKEAGLNPHLIYGQGNSGNSSAPAAPQQFQQDYSGFADSISSYVATRKQQTEIDNLQKAKEVMEADEQLKKAQAASQLSTAAKTNQEREQSSQLFLNTVAQAEANLKNSQIISEKLSAEIGSILQNTNASKQTVKESEQRIIESSARIKSMAVDNNLKGVESELKKVELSLRRAGINPNDPAWARILGRILDESGMTDKVIKGAKEGPGMIERGYNWFKRNTPSFRDWLTN